MDAQRAGEEAQEQGRGLVGHQGLPEAREPFHEEGKGEMEQSPTALSENFITIFHREGQVQGLAEGFLQPPLSLAGTNLHPSQSQSAFCGEDISGVGEEGPRLLRLLEPGLLYGTPTGPLPEDMG